jgi:hypothetical protein
MDGREARNNAISEEHQQPIGEGKSPIANPYPISPKPTTSDPRLETPVRHTKKARRPATGHPNRPPKSTPPAVCR